MDPNPKVVPKVVPKAVPQAAPQMENLVEIEAIKQLKARYFRLMDTKQWEAWGEVFAVDARLQWGESEADAATGRDNIVAAVSQAVDPAVTCHHGHMPEIEIVDSQRARGVWAMHDRVDHPDYLLEGYGHYHEEYVKVAGEWKIQRTRLTRLHRDFALKKPSRSQ